MTARIRQAVRALEAYTPGEQPTDPRIVKLNTNENPYPPSPRVTEVLRSFDVDRLRRYPDPLCRALRERLGSLHDVAPEQVFVGNGSDEVLALCTRAFVEDDGQIGFFDTSYSLYPVLADIRVVARRAFPLTDDFAWREPEPDGAVSLFFLTNPNAPTGACFPPETVARFCERQTGVVLIDEAYAEFASHNALGLARRLPNVLVARTLSKAYSLAGLRLGYAIGPAALIGALYKIKDSYNVCALSQAVALAALGDVESMRANVARVCATRERARAGLEALGYAVWPSDANFLWVRPPTRPAKEVFQALREAGIVVRYFAGERTGGHLRVTIGTDAQIDALLEAVRDM